MVDDRPCILCDTREQRPLHFSANVDVEIVTLDTGDYSIRGHSDVVRIERKAMGDLWQCCGAERRRFEAELERLRSFRIRAVVIEASITGVLMTPPRGRVKPETVIRSTVGWAQDFEIGFVWADDARTAAAWTERALVRVWRKAKARRAA